MRHHPRTDTNQTAITKALKAAGATVLSLAAMGKGCPDLLVGYHGANLLVEVKDGAKVPSRRKLTADQVQWHADWRGQVCVVTSVKQALELLVDTAMDSREQTERYWIDRQVKQAARVDAIIARAEKITEQED